MSDVTFYTEADAQPTALSGVEVAVIGYGNLGRAMALNLRDSAVTVRVGNRDDDYRSRAREDGFAVDDIATAAADADLLYLLIPDEEIPGCLSSDIAPSLRPGQGLVFASGYPLAFAALDVPDTVDLLLLAPRMLGEQVRETYLDGTGFLSYLSVERDASGAGWPRLLALASAAGSLRRGAVGLSARDEAVLDLFIEQSVGPSIGMAIQLAFAQGVEAGLPPEAMVLEMYMSGEMARTFQTFADVGFFRSATWHGMVAQFGGYLGTLEVDGEKMAERFRNVLERIESGDFARQLEQERRAGYPTMETIAAITGSDNPITAAEQRVRTWFERDAGEATD